MSSLQIDMERLTPRERYFLLTASVVPRPIAWVSTVDSKGNQNLAPYSFFNACSSNPPIVHFTSTAEKDTIRNVRETGQFVVNIVSHELGPAMRITSASFSPEQNEFEWASVTAAPSNRIRPPRVAQAKVALECSLVDIVTMGEGRIAFGEVLVAHVSESVWAGDRIDSTLLRPLARLSGNEYATISETYRLHLPEWFSRATADYEVHGGPAGPKGGDG